MFLKYNTDYHTINLNWEMLKTEKERIYFEIINLMNDRTAWKIFRKSTYLLNLLYNFKQNVLQYIIPSKTIYLRLLFMTPNETSLMNKICLEGRLAYARKPDNAPPTSHFHDRPLITDKDIILLIIHYNLKYK